MKKVGIIGHFGYGKKCYDGQTVKTHMLTDALREKIGSDEIITVDTIGGIKSIFKLIMQCFAVEKNCHNVIMLPAHNGLKVFVPVLSFFNMFFNRKLHYSVIGGWLPVYVEKHRVVGKLLKKFDFIYVETRAMKSDLEKSGYTNITVVPNFKNIPVLSNDGLIFKTDDIFRFCTFSRVSKEKGIEDAIDAITRINNENGKTVCTLDIYGRVDSDYIERFSSLEKEFPSFVRYHGSISPEKSVETIKNYYALLFPTHHATEGIPGTIIDALCAGVVTLARRWNSADDIIIQNTTGIIYPNEIANDLYETIKWSIENQETVNRMKPDCIEFASDFLPEKAIKIILDNIDSMV